MKLKEVAKILGCPKLILNRRIRSGKLAAKKVGGRWEVELREVKKCLRKWPVQPNRSEGYVYVDEEFSPAQTPCPHPPGSRRRIETYRTRAALHENLFHPNDRKAWG